MLLEQAQRISALLLKLLQHVRGGVERWIVARIEDGVECADDIDIC